jgi:hydroxymethylbilane synthase
MGATLERIRIATRESQLAMRQTNMVADALRAVRPGLRVDLVPMTTKGDRVLDRPLAQVGGKGLFVKELEIALAEERADIAVHSLKDVPMELPAGFALRTFGEREEPLDAFVSSRHASLDAMPAGSVVGTSSLRRECQLRRAFPALAFRALRGNVNTRLAKLDRGEYDAVILAVAGLRRLGFEDRIRAVVPASVSLPAIGQGILAIEFLERRGDLDGLLAPLERRDVAAAARAERALGLVVEGSCEVPVGGLARVSGGALTLEGFIGVPEGSEAVRAALSGEAERARELGTELGERLLASGGREILERLLARRPA